MRNFWLGIAFAVPLAVGWATTSSPSGDASHDAICAGGAEDPIDVSFEITAVDRTDRGERLTVHAAVHNHFDVRARTVMAYELVDDRGNVIVEAKKSPVAAVESRDQRVEVLTTPEHLEHGFYELRATVAGIEEKTGEDSIAIKSMFFEVGDSGVLPITHDEFLMKSNANLAFLEPGSDEEVKR